MNPMYMIFVVMSVICSFSCMTITPSEHKDCLSTHETTQTHSAVQASLNNSAPRSRREGRRRTSKKWQAASNSTVSSRTTSSESTTTAPQPPTIRKNFSPEILAWLTATIQETNTHNEKIPYAGTNWKPHTEQ